MPVSLLAIKFALLVSVLAPSAAAEPRMRLVNPAESARTYSTVAGRDAIGTGHARSMLDSPQAWSAATSNLDQEWAQVDLGAVMSVGGVVTQPRAGYYRFQYVTSLRVSTSTDGTSWIDVDGGAAFTANTAARSRALGTTAGG